MAKALLASTASSRGPAFGEAQVQMVNGSGGDLVMGNTVNMSISQTLSIHPGDIDSIYGTFDTPQLSPDASVEAGLVAPSFILAEDILAGGTGACWMFGANIMALITAVANLGQGSALATETGAVEIGDPATVMRYVGWLNGSALIGSGTLERTFFNGWSGFAG